MTDYFRVQGRALLANGYLVVPIKPNEKRPAISSWQKARLGPADLDSYPSHGVGVICGQGAHPVVAIDIDIHHPDIATALLEWCRKWLPGPAPERVGRAPRTLLVYRAAEAGWTKGSSTSFASEDGTEQKVEVLGFGQQFVAYATHPDTGRPYDWIDWLGGIESVRAADLPLISEADLGNLMAEVDRLVRASGLTIKRVGETSRAAGISEADWMLGLVPPVGVPLAEATALLSFYREFEDHDTWLRVGMALHHEYDGSEDAFKVWADWSAASTKFDAAAMRQRWQSFGKARSRSPTTLRWLLKVANEAKRDHDVEVVRDQITALKVRIAAATDAVQMTGPLAKALKKDMPADPAAVVEVQKAFGDKFRELAGVSLPVAEIRKLLNGLRVVKPTRRPLTEFGNAERMLDRYAAGLMYVPELDHWYVWTGVYWRRAPEIEIHHYAKETIRGLINEAEEHEGSAEFFEFCAASQQARMVKNMVTLASSDPRIAVPASQLDRDWWLVGCLNGVINLKEGGKLMAASPEYRITTLCGAEYLADAKAPLFIRTLADVFENDLELMRFFHRLMGYVFTGNPTEDVMVIPYGNGSNGKSTVLNVIREAMGGYARVSGAETFVSTGGNASSSGGPREDIVRLKGSRMVYSSEPEESSELRESAVKSMSGGDSIPARGLFSRTSIEIQPSWVVIMPTNHKPIIKGNDNGIWRRMVLLPFNVNFETTGTKDPDREAKLRLEKAGVLSWLVAGALRYLDAGLQPPNAIRAARDEYRSQMDLLSDWLEECCEIEANFTESSSALWISWENWARKNGCINYVKSSIALNRRLENRFSSIKGSGGRRMRRGLRLKRDLEPFSSI